MKSTYHKIASYEAKKGTFKKILLLYSGGLDTSVMIKWLMDHYDAEIHTLTINLGQEDNNFDEIKQKAINLGVKKATILDAQKEFAEDFLTKAIKANANYQHGYHLFCPLGRAVIAKKVVEVAQKEKINVLAHGCTGKGNDQVRFDSYLTTLDPSIKILAPVREWEMTRTEEIAYAKKHKIPLSSHSKEYSYDENLWGISAEGGDIEDVSKEPNLKKILLKNKLPEDSSPKPANVSIDFEKGIPVKLNGKKIDMVNMLKALATLGAEHGIGTRIFVEDRIFGLKVRGVYEQPAAEILVSAHQELEKLVSTRDENEFKAGIDAKWAYLCYSAKWLEPLMDNLNSFIDKHNEKVTGKVTCKLYKGNFLVTAIDSPYSLFDQKMASFDSKNHFNQQASAGFIELYSMQQKMAYQVSKRQ
ncbi:MAG: argininosuccinate synthase [Patescibacteria group bacterium]|nr:argininosuccinate synthase [Patescibacteria group bacterium]